MPDQVLNKIHSSIKYQSKDLIFSHIKTIFLFRYNYTGKIEENSFTIWKMGLISGSFYSVIYGEIKIINGKKRVNVKTRLNSFGRFLTISFMALYSYALTFGILIQENNEWIYLWKRFIVCAILSILPLALFRLIRNYEKRQTVREFKEMIYDKP
jgi:hypothetical protein